METRDSPSRRRLTPPSDASAAGTPSVQTSLSLPHHPASVRPARVRLRTDLQSAGVPADIASDAELVLSELVGNAVRHAHGQPGGTVAVSWRVSVVAVELEVVDGGSPGVVAVRPVTELAPGGRGLHIVESLCRSWGVAERPGGRTVWARLPLPSR